MKIELYCHNCAEPLIASVNDINITPDCEFYIPVVPCSSCIEAERKQGYDAGYIEGQNG